MLSDTQVPVLLTQQHLVNKLPKSDAFVVCLDSDWHLPTQQMQENPISTVTPDNLVYVIYTSGSTGKPKGVMNIHKGLCNRLLWMQDTYQLTEADCFAQKTPFSFDVSVWELFCPLVIGARLVIARPEGHKDRAYLVNLIAEQKITTLHFVPSMLEIFLAQKRLEGCNSLTRVICSGEALPFEIQERFFTCLNAELHNLDGPTEASIEVTFWHCQHRSNQRVVPIGRPIANTQMHILDSHLQPVPVGVVGELHIGGIGLARGYLNRPDLTAEKFISNPFQRSKGVEEQRLDFARRPDAGVRDNQFSSSERLYKTGDLARYQKEGVIEYLGRIDNQVKISGGLRIELGEIESVLRQHPAVQQTVVTATEDTKGYKCLVAYVVPNIKGASITRELRQYLKQELPEYMVPGIFMFLNTLPLNSNGKVDRRALPVPSQAKQESEKTFVAPRDELELQLAKIWENVLGIKRIGIKDNFFELGGYSLLAMRLFAQIEEKFQRNLPMATLFQSPTIEEFSNMIRQSKLPVSWSLLVPIQPNGSKPPFFCIHPIEGNVLGYYSLSHYLAADQPFYGIQAQGLDGEQPACTRIEDMASRYIQEIQTLQPKGPYLLGGYSFGGIVAFEMAQQLHKQGEKVALLALFDTRARDAESRLPFVQRVPLHLKNLLQKGPAYIQKKVKQWLSYLLSLLQYEKQKIVYKFYQSSDGPVPLSVRRVPLKEAHTQAFKKYTLKPYPGRVIVFGVEEKMRQEGEGYKLDPNFGWSHLVTGGLEIHNIPGSHSSILTEPHVKVVAEKLQACLESAQATVVHLK